MDERELLQKLSVKAESGPIHTDAHTDSGHADSGHTNAHINSTPP